MKALILFVCCTSLSYFQTYAQAQDDEPPMVNAEVVGKIQAIVNESYELKNLAERDALVKKKCSQLEATVEKSIALLGKMLQSKNKKEVRIAATGLNAIGLPAIEYVPQLIALQDQGIVTSRFEFVMVAGIRQDLQKAETAPKILIRFLKHENRGVVWWTYETLLRMNRRAINLLPYLVQIMDDQRHEVAVRQFACEVIGTMGEKATWAIPSLVGQLTDSKSQIDSVSQLERIGEAVLEDVIPELDHPSSIVKRRVLDLFSRMKEKALPGLAKVKKLIGAKNKFVSYDAAFAFWRMTGDLEMIRPVLQKAIVDVELADRACHFVYEMDKKAVAFTSEIIQALSQKEFTERTKEMLILTLGKIGPAGMASTNILELYCKDESLKLKNVAAVSLWQVSGNAKLPVETLVTILNSELPRLKHRYYSYAIQGLGDIGPAAKDGVPILKNFMMNDSSTRRHYAAQSLAQIGGPGEKVLREALKSEDSKLRKKAQWALEKYIDKKDESMNN